MKKTAHIMPNYSKYGSIVGYICLAVGFNNIFCKNMKEAKSWCSKHGFEAVKL
jgi:hypothetical protein